MSSDRELEGYQLLLSTDVFLSAGVHIGTKIKTADMAQFIYRARPDGLFQIDIRKTDERIRVAARFIAQYDPKDVVTVSLKLYGKTPVEKFCEVTGTIPIVGRFLPGLFTNPYYEKHLEPKLVIVSDPKVDFQAITEANALGIPIIALCDTDNTLSYVDLVIPSNNKGRKALATIFWLLAREVLRERGELGKNEDLSIPIEQFETIIE